MFPDELFAPEAASTREVTVVGELAQAYVENTMALRRANNKLVTICLAVDRCKETIGSPLSAGVTK